ncbi:MAG TPA: hypothetical protein VN604_08070, partial [Nitrospirota bacterium]|nr:hypothetical protein [Nitrospirota bacterium]
AGFRGLAPLLTMLNSCASGVAVMNIDNGFGAGVLAHRINLLEKKANFFFLSQSRGARGENQSGIKAALKRRVINKGFSSLAFI